MVFSVKWRRKAFWWGWKREIEKAGLKLNIKKISMASISIASWQVEGDKVEAVTRFIFLGSKITADGDCNHIKALAPWKKSYDKPRQHTKKHRHFTDKGLWSQSCGFSSGHVWESWAVKKAECWQCFRIVLEMSPLNSTEIKPVSSKGIQPWIFTRRTEAEAPIIWPPDVKSQLIFLFLRKRPWCWARLKAKEGGGGGWDC